MGGARGFGASLPEATEERGRAFAWGGGIKHCNVPKRREKDLEGWTLHVGYSLPTRGKSDRGVALRGWDISGGEKRGGGIIVKEESLKGN